VRHPRSGFGPVPPGYAAAFAEGRRLREYSHHARYRPPPRRPPGTPTWLLVVLLLPLLGLVPLLVGGLGLLALFEVVPVLTVPIVPLVLLGATTFALTRHARRRAALRRGGAAGTTPLPARPAAPPRPDLAWRHVHHRFDALRSAYAAYECDPMAVLRLPALADVAVPSTARFVDAFAEAQALETEKYPGEPHGSQFMAAVDRAERAWRAAREAAERIRLSTLTPQERATVERVIKLLTTARDSDSDAERLAAYARARSELAKLDAAGVVHVPLPAQAALEEASRGQLPA
jgi:hypothetical protein